MTKHMKRPVGLTAKYKGLTIRLDEEIDGRFLALIVSLPKPPPEGFAEDIKEIKRGIYQGYIRVDDPGLVILEMMGKRARYEGHTVYVEWKEKNRYHASVRGNLPNDFFEETRQSDRDLYEGYIKEDDPNLFIDSDSGRLVAEGLAAREFDGWQHAWYKGHRLRVGSVNLHLGHYSVHYTVPENEELPDQIDWLEKATPLRNRRCYGQIPVSETPNLTFEEEQIWKMAFYKGFWTLVLSKKDDQYTINIALPYREICQELDWLQKFDDGYGDVPTTDPDLYIDDLGLIREDLLTKTFPVNWRDATYKGEPIKVGAHSATHHFVTYHSDNLLPRGVLPEFLQPAAGQPPFAIQTSPQDFMAKIPIDAPDLKLPE